MLNETYHQRGESIHGYSPIREHPLYTTWADIKQRCGNPDVASYPDYGGRGITYCERWKHFVNFATDMWPKPIGTEIDRIDNNKGYSPDNCRWVSRPQNAQNKRTYKNNKFESGGVNRPGNYALRYMENGVRYNLGRFNTVSDAEVFKSQFREVLRTDPRQAKDMLVRRARLDSQTGIRGITRHKSGYIVRKTVDGKRLYLGHAVDLDDAISILLGLGFHDNTAA